MLKTISLSDLINHAELVASKHLPKFINSLPKLYKDSWIRSIAAEALEKSLPKQWITMYMLKYREKK